MLKLGALAVLIVSRACCSVPRLTPAEPLRPSMGQQVTLAVGAALVPVLFAIGGWQQTNFMAEEIIEPERNLPRALLAGVSIVVAVYLLANVVYLRTLGIAGLAASSAPAADAMTPCSAPPAAASSPQGSRYRPSAFSIS